MKNIVVLNSGGYDSIVLSHYVDVSEGDVVITDLFFNWGQNNYEKEIECAKKCAEKLSHKFKEITINNFNWCNSSITNGVGKSQYVPMRNLVFLSYALSFAESIKADKIYCAFVNPNVIYYPDTSPKFLENINMISRSVGVEIIAPFMNEYKDVLLKSLVRIFGIDKSEVHSCNFSNNPCGVCPDCKMIDYIFEGVEAHLIDDMLIDNNFEFTDEMVDNIKRTRIVGAKLFINNKCQFNCKHCFIGKKELISTELNNNEWSCVIDDMADSGVKYIDFFGKEPLYNGDVFKYIQKCKERGIKYTLITNGLNVKKYLDRLKEYEVPVTISVENIEKNTKFRSTGGFIEDTIKLLIENGIEVSVSIDLSYSNLDNLYEILNELFNIGVENFYIKPLRPFGSSDEFLADKILSSKDLIKAFNILREFKSFCYVRIEYSLSSMDIHRIYLEETKAFNELFKPMIIGREDGIDGVFVTIEYYNSRYENYISITPDGYVLGGASEYCLDYSKYPNVRNHTFLECVRMGKDELKLEDYNIVGDYFSKNYSKRGVKVLNIVENTCDV